MVNNNGVAIVAIDTRVVPTLVETVKRAIAAVGATKAFIWCAPDNADWARDAFCFENVDVCVTELADADQLPTTPERYSHLLLRPDPIWTALQSANVRHALFVQSDVTILRAPTRHELKVWQRYAYIGAPWTSFNPCRKFVPHGVGNGGVSLRSVEDCIEALEKINEKQRDTWPEDVYFARTIDTDRVAPINIAAGFACEVPIPELHMPEAPPFALHKAQSFCPRDLCKAWGVVDT